MITSKEGYGPKRMVPSVPLTAEVIHRRFGILRNSFLFLSSLFFSTQDCLVLSKICLLDKFLKILESLWTARLKKLRRRKAVFRAPKRGLGQELSPLISVKRCGFNLARDDEAGKAPSPAATGLAPRAVRVSMPWRPEDLHRQRRHGFPHVSQKDEWAQVFCGTMLETST